MQSLLPVTDKTFRFAPAFGTQPASYFWRIWSKGTDVYLSCRIPGSKFHFSIHQSGQIHHRTTAKEKQDITPLLRLDSGPWSHAIEVRFLLSRSALPRLHAMESLKNRKAYLIPVPDDSIFHANLLISDAGIPLDCPLPAGFLPAAQTLWRVRLRDNRLAVLVGRLLELSNENREHDRFIRQELKPTATLSSVPSGEEQLEVHQLQWSPHGSNVVFVVPMGQEAFRSDQEPVAPHEQSQLRTFSLEAEDTNLTICAPDGKPVVAVRLTAFCDSISVVKGRPCRVIAGRLHLDLLLPNLVLGSSFIATPCKMRHAIKIGAASPRNWSYSITARFDGATMTVELLPLSTALRNTNLANPVHALAENEELSLLIPRETLKFTLTSLVPMATCELTGKLTLREQC